MPDTRTPRSYATALSEALAQAAHAFDRLHARLFDAPWEQGRSHGRTC